MRSAAIPFLMMLCCACTASQTADEGDGAWVGTVTTEDDVTTVVNESGSVWGGTARLVEEASIGIERGDDAYMLAEISSMVAAGDRIYLLETEPPQVRVYDFDGVHLFDIGSEGQGPGELLNPMSLVVAGDGRVVVRDDRADRMTIFSAAGELLDTWTMPGGFSTSDQMVLTHEGRIFTPEPAEYGGEGQRPGWDWAAYGLDGEAGESIPAPVFDYERPKLPEVTLRMAGGGRMVSTPSVPYYAAPTYLFSPVGAIVSGVGDRYRFEIRNLDGAVTIVERLVEAAPISREEAEWQRRYVTARMKNMDPGWSWDGPDVPDHKPFYEELFPDQNGRIWVQRYAPSNRVADCDERPTPKPTNEIRRCWEDAWSFEVFGADGRFLGGVGFPPGVSQLSAGHAFIHDDVVLLQMQDEVGTPMVKRYRLVAPNDDVDLTKGR